MPEAIAVKKRRHSKTLAPLGEWRNRSGLTFVGLEVRDGDQSGNLVAITGMPIVYGIPYTVCDMLGEFEETMEPGVLSSVLGSTPDVRFLGDHSTGITLARTASGTMTLTDTTAGLTFRALVDIRSTAANDWVIAIERGDISQMSCGFIVGRDVWNADYTQRSITQIAELLEISAVTFPASPTTSISLALRRAAQPLESRARLRQAWIQSREVREGKVLSAENAGLLQQALEALHEADDVDIPSIVESLQRIDSALDAGQAGVSSVLGKVDPDGGSDDLEPALESAATDAADEDGGADGDDEADESNPSTAGDGTTRAAMTDDEARYTIAEARAIIAAEQDPDPAVADELEQRSTALELEQERMRLRGARRHH